MGQKNSIKRKFHSWIPLKRNKIHVTTKLKPLKTPVVFQESLRTTLVIGQIFSLTPFTGILSNKASEVKFKRTSWKIIYTFVSFVGQIFMAVTCVFRVLYSDSSLIAITAIFFYGTTVITMLMFFQVAKALPCLMQHIARTEDLVPNFDTKLTFRCNLTATIVLTLSLLEHTLSLITAYAETLVCHPNIHLYEGFVKHFYPWVFNIIPYTLALGIMTQFLHFQSTFIWNYSDLFVINMSYYLTSRLKQINKKLKAAQGKYLPQAFWRTSREEYTRATQLVRKMDDVISGIVFISFANNLFFICLQLFNTLEDGISGTGECSSRAKEKANAHILGGYEGAIYFIFSLVYLIARSVAVSLIASEVNSASTEPASVLYDVPSPVYCIEVQRFIDQVNGDKVALSGLQFFNVTRGLLLTIAGTIVTYELVMVQFNSPSSSTTQPSTNTTTTVPFTVTTATP